MKPIVNYSLRAPWWAQSLALLFLAVVIVVASVSTSNASAQVSIFPGEIASGDASVRLERRPATPWVKAGEEVTYVIYAEPESVGTSAAEITLDYGRDLELVEVTAGPYLGDQPIPGPQSIDTEKRQATYAWARVGVTPPNVLPGDLAYVTFRAAAGHAWNTWVRQRVRLVDAQLTDVQQSDTSFYLHVYDRLPVPVAVRPSARFQAEGAYTGPQAAFSVRTFSPAHFKYKIEVSQDHFQSALLTFDQTISPVGWDQNKYVGGSVAGFVSQDPLEPGTYQWRVSAWIEEIDQWTEPSEEPGR